MSKEYTRSHTIYGNVALAGQIMDHDDFESLLKWVKFEGEGDSIFELDPTLAKHGNQSLYIKTRTTDAAIGDEIGAFRRTHCGLTQNMAFI
ncbi:unnamed protein product, partial [marine sediment metagenome]